MLREENLREFTKRFQTNEINVVREYVQHLFLSALYKIKGSENLLFKGGTALRIIYQSPRFSEDLDFTGQNIYSHQMIDTLFLESLVELEKTGLDIAYKEAKPTTGGYLGLIHYELFNFKEDMKFEVSLRKEKSQKSNATNIVSDFLPPYIIVQLSAENIVTGKIAALLSRKKPRDYYDLYFMLRHPQLNKLIDKKTMPTILTNLKKEKINFKTELAMLLPASYHLLLRNFKDLIAKEIESYL